MIGWVTDNGLSRTVMELIPNIEIRHIVGFLPLKCDHVFYGILRGCSRAMHSLAEKGIDYHYIDNGYFDALYVDKNKQKSMDGKFRVVKNGMHELYPHGGLPSKPTNILVLPPSPYSANFYNTTPEDWIQLACSGTHGNMRIRTKDITTPLENDLAWCDGVLSFNSMALMRAVEMGKVVKDTHGIFRRKEFARYNIDDLRAFYEPKQFTLKELSEGKCKFT
jgi:hypothetical protein